MSAWEIACCRMVKIRLSITGLNRMSRPLPEITSSVDDVTPLETPTPEPVPTEDPTSEPTEGPADTEAPESTQSEAERGE